MCRVCVKAHSTYDVYCGLFYTTRAPPPSPLCLVCISAGRVRKVNASIEDDEKLITKLKKDESEKLKVPHNNHTNTIYYSTCYCINLELINWQ